MRGPRDHFCNCDNARFAGIAIPSDGRPNIPRGERERLCQCESVFAADLPSFEVRDSSQITVTTHSHACTDVVCQLCGTTLRFFAGSAAVFIGLLHEVGRTPPDHPPPISLTPVAGSLFPPFTRPLIKPRVTLPPIASGSSSNYDYSEFEEMFSAVPVVGSWHGGDSSWSPKHFSPDIEKDVLDCPSASEAEQ
jgi:hypothetical protein